MLSGKQSVRYGAALRNRWGLRLILLCFCFVLSAGSAAGCARKETEPVLEPMPDQRAEEQETDGTDGTGADAQAGDPGAQSQAGDPGTSGTAGDNGEEEQARMVTVHVCGAVQREDVYTLPAGSRIRDAVEAAGGFAEDADTAYLNLAMEIGDAWQIRIPTREESDALRRGADPSALYGAGAAAESGLVSAGGAGGAAALQENAGNTGNTDNSGGSGNAGDPGAAQTGAGSGSEEAAGRAPDGSARVDLNTASKEELMTIPGIGETRAQRILEYREQNGGFRSIEELMNISGIKDASFQKLRDYVYVSCASCPGLPAPGKTARLL